jgi:hypothetical protein
MLNIMSLKKQKAAAAEAGPKKGKTSAAQIRLQKGTNKLLVSGRCECAVLIEHLYSTDFSDMDKLPRTMKLEFANADDLFKFSLIITPDEGGNGLSGGLQSPKPNAFVAILRILQGRDLQL